MATLGEPGCWTFYCIVHFVGCIMSIVAVAADVVAFI